MAKNQTKPPEEVKPPEETKNPYVSPGTENSQAGEIALTQENIGDKPQPSMKKVIKDEPKGLFEKVFHNEHGMTKHYQKFEREQKVTKNPNTGLEIMVFADNGQECPYFENLGAGELAIHKLFS